MTSRRSLKFGGTFNILYILRRGSSTIKDQDAIYLAIQLPLDPFDENAFQRKLARFLGPRDENKGKAAWHSKDGAYLDRSIDQSFQILISSTIGSPDQVI
jgi:hypothetical protein